MKTALEVFKQMRDLENAIDRLDEYIAEMTERLEELQVQREMKEGELKALERELAGINLDLPKESTASVSDLVEGDRFLAQMPKPGRPRQREGTVPPAVKEVGGVLQDSPISGMTVAALASQLGISNHAASVRIQTALKEGLVIRVKRGHYCLTPRGRASMADAPPKQDLAGSGARGSQPEEANADQT